MASRIMMFFWILLKHAVFIIRPIIFKANELTKFNERKINLAKLLFIYILSIRTFLFFIEIRFFLNFDIAPFEHSMADVAVLKGTPVQLLLDWKWIYSKWKKKNSYPILLVAIPRFAFQFRKMHPLMFESAEIIS